MLVRRMVIQKILIHFVHIFQLLLVLQMLCLEVERQISRKERALDLIKVAELLQELLLLKLIDHVCLIVELLKACAKSLV